MAQLIAPKICTKNDSYVPQLRCKFQVSTFSRFKVIAFFYFCLRIRKYARKKHKDFRAKRRGSPKIRFILQVLKIQLFFFETLQPNV